MQGYVRFAALGDSTTAGIGDPTPVGWRGWARLLADALATTYDVSFCNLACPAPPRATCATTARRRRWRTGRTWPRSSSASTTRCARPGTRSGSGPSCSARAGALHGAGRRAAHGSVPRPRGGARAAVGAAAAAGRSDRRVNEVYDEIHARLRRRPDRPGAAARDPHPRRTGRSTGCTPPSAATGPSPRRSPTGWLDESGLRLRAARAWTPAGGVPSTWRTRPRVDDAGGCAVDGPPCPGPRARGRSGRGRRVRVAP